MMAIGQVPMCQPTRVVHFIVIIVMVIGTIFEIYVYVQTLIILDITLYKINIPSNYSKMSMLSYASGTPGSVEQTFPLTFANRCTETFIPRLPIGLIIIQFQTNVYSVVMRTIFFGNCKTRR